MTGFNFHKAIVRLESLKDLLNEGKPLGIDATQLTGKVDSVISALVDQVIRIVLLGSFSDGKTSAIAGLLGELKENMKIDQDESSDDLAIYRFDGVKNVEIIDTPGLFGTKEKEIDGKTVKYSEITQRYISEANIVIYVCDAVTPLKESHVEIIRKVLRDFNKLPSTIFVINKMDEAGIDMLDENDYKRGSEIKKRVLVNRLKDTMGLTEEEAEHLHIACISADPKGKGLAHWFSKMESYRNRSHIGLLSDSITDIVSSSDIRQLKSDTNMAVITEVVNETQYQIDALTGPIDQALEEIRFINADLIQDKGALRQDLMVSKARLLEDLHNLSTSIKTDIDEADLTTINGLIENKLGLVGGTLDYHILDSSISMTIALCVESNNYAISSRFEEFAEKIEIQSKIINDALKFGADKLGKVKLANTDILKVRDFLGQYFKWAKNIKFKPHGAGKLATRISKGAGVFGTLISVGLDLKSYFKEKKDLKRLAELKTSLKTDISAKFEDIYSVMNRDQDYFENFAPSYIELCKLVDERNAEMLKLQNQIIVLRHYNEQIEQWMIDNREHLSES